MTSFSFDTEDNSKGKPFLFNFYAIETGEHFTFYDQIEALDYVCATPKRTYWAVNLEYDINNLFRGYYGLLHFIYAGSRLITCELRADRIRFLDTLNHWPMSVKKMGDRIGIPKLEMCHTGKTPAKRLLRRAIKELRL